MRRRLLALVVFAGVLIGAHAPAMGSDQQGATPQGSPKNLTDDDMERAKFCIDHHSVEFRDESYKEGATRVPTVDKDEDGVRYWTISPSTTRKLLADINGDGLGDVVLYMQCNDDYHLVAMINRGGKPVQTCDLLIRSTQINPGELKLESGMVVTDWLDYTSEKKRVAKFKVVDGALVLAEPTPALARKQGFTVETIPLTPNPRDIANPKIPRRIPKITTSASLDTVLKVTALNKANILKGLRKLGKQLDLIDEWNGLGSIQSITYGDLNRDGQKDAAVIFGVERADHTQLLLIPALIDHGRLRFVGRAEIGAGGFDTWRTKVRIAAGVIHVSVETFDKGAVTQPKNPWVSMRFKIYQGKQLLKLR